MVAESKGIPGSIEMMKYSPNGRFIALAGQEGTIYFIDSLTGDTVHFVRAHTDPIRSIGWSLDGTRFVSNSAARELKIWDLATSDELVVFGPRSRFGEVADWTPNGRQLVTATRQGTVTFWGSSDMDVPLEPPASLESGILARFLSESDSMKSEESLIQSR